MHAVCNISPFVLLQLSTHTLHLGSRMSVIIHTEICRINLAVWRSRIFIYFHLGGNLSNLGDVIEYFSDFSHSVVENFDKMPANNTQFRTSKSLLIVNFHLHHIQSCITPAFEIYREILMNLPIAIHKVPLCFKEFPK